MSPDQTILFATDLSESALDGYSFAVALSRAASGPLHAVHVRAGASAAEDAALLPAQARAAHDGELVTSVLEVDAPERVPESIVDYAAENGVGVVVMGARGQWGRRRPLLGGIAQAVVRTAPCSVLTVRGRIPPAGPRRILAPIDFSTRSADSLRMACELAGTFDATVDVLHVVVPELPSYTVFPSARPGPEVASKWEQELRAFVREARAGDASPALHVRVGHPATTILNFALERGADLVVISASGDGGDATGELGSVARGVSHSSICSTLTVRPAVAMGGRKGVSQPRPATEPEPARPAHHRYGEASLARRFRRTT